MGNSRTESGQWAPPGALAVATIDDAPELLVLQRCCWVGEAILNDTLAIPALHEDLDTVREWVERMDVRTLRRGGRLIGAVRLERRGERCEIGRLMVAPDLQGEGIGRRLLEFAESQVPAGVRHLDLYTGARSERNIRMYTAAGYAVAEPPPEFGHLVAGAVFLTKPNPLAP
ncbi:MULTISPECIES: GNAT family N-acetyltransferase [Amycolatopsis]|uniref:Acetyltransferase (GNAT) domain-containing protein n=2 Tax=Amycolatopsis TaxID=1813 RepID=A0A1I3X4V7_9PSEU|nr:GNAT family N-acetyltransferase [Amycolatopsis sacchari]SFK14594.1 Acetyltransferase (GNAT) domain-containing protein [Amycolatopsis sacchari]